MFIFTGIHIILQSCQFFVKKHLQNYVHLHLQIFTSAHLHSHLYLCSSSHLHIYISAHLHILTSTSLLIFIFTYPHLCSCSHLCIYISAHLHILASTSHICTSRSSLLSLLRPGAVPPEHHETQPSAEIVHVEGAKCRRERVLSLSGATLCGDCAYRGREMQARVRFGLVRRNPLRRSCASRARNAGESAFWPGPGQPSAEIVRVDFVVQLWYAEQSVELEAENWPLCSAT